MARQRKINKQQTPTAVEIQPAKHSFKLVFVVVNHGLADTLTDILHKEGTVASTSLFGRGTAPAQFLSLLGMDEQKDVVVALVESSKTQEVLDKLKKEIRSNGVAFTVKLSSIGGVNAMKLLLGGKYEPNS